MSRKRVADKHLPPCVYFKHGSYWLVKRGKWERLAATMPEALAEYARRTQTHTKGSMPELIERVLAHVSPKLAKSTQSQYRTAGERLKKFMAEFSPEQVRPKHVAAIKMHMAYTPNMANRVLSVLRIVFQHAVEWQLCESNPCVGIKRHEEAKRTRYITDAEYSAIYAVAPPRLQIIMDMLFLTGQRINDVLRIRYADIGQDGITFAQQKTGARLLVRWSPDLRNAVERARTLHGNLRALTLLQNRRGKAPDYSSTKIQWNHACEKAGVTDAHIHDLRAKSLTHAKQQGFNPQTLAGHTSAVMTDRYIRLRETPQADGPEFAKILDSH
jgi:integrase